MSVKVPAWWMWPVALPFLILLGIVFFLLWVTAECLSFILGKEV